MPQRLLGLIGSRFFGTLGFQLLAVWSFYTAYQNTGSAFKAGLLGLALFLPTLTLSLIGGVYADRRHRIGRSYAIAQGAQLLPTALLFFCSSSYAVTFFSLALISALRSLRSPLFYSLLGVYKSQQEPQSSPSGLAKLNTLSWQIPLVLAPAFISLSLEKTSSPFPVLAAIACVQVISVGLSLPFLRLRREAPVPTQKVLNYFHELSAKKSLVLPLYADAALATLLGLSVFLPFHIRSLDLGPENFGYLKSLFHLTALMVSLLFPLRLMQRFEGSHFTKLVFLWGFVILSLGFTTNIVGLSVGIASLGILDGLSSLYRENLIFHNVSPAEMGKVSSLNSFLISTGDELGEFNAGWILTKFGEGAYFASNFVMAIFLSLYMKQFLGARQDYKSPKLIKENT
jgi:hypothetical protein